MIRGQPLDAPTVIATFLLDRYLREARDATVKDIVAGTGLAEATVRRTLPEVPGLQEQRISRAQVPDYPGYGNRTVTVYGPSRATLAAHLRRLAPLNGPPVT